MTVFDWLRKTFSTARPSEASGTSQMRFRKDVFCRTREDFLRGAELETVHEEVPAGVPILHYFCYKSRAPWCIESLCMSVWGGSLIANFCIDGQVLATIWFSDFDDGWLMAFAIERGRGCGNRQCLRGLSVPQR